MATTRIERTPRMAIIWPIGSVVPMVLMQLSLRIKQAMAMTMYRPARSGWVRDWERGMDSLYSTGGINSTLASWLRALSRRAAKASRDDQRHAGIGEEVG